jgi:hypothetical protein
MNFRPFLTRINRSMMDQVMLRDKRIYSMDMGHVNTDLDYCGISFGSCLIKVLMHGALGELL